MRSSGWVILSPENQLYFGRHLHIVYRILAGLALFWALVNVFPDHLERNAWVVLLWMVYPGFRQQYVSVNTSRHMLPLVLFFLSIAFMASSVRGFESRKDRKAPFMLLGISLLASAIAMLSTEYFYGLEMLRPVIVFMVLDTGIDIKSRIKKTGIYWLPYLVLLSAVFLWRYLVSTAGNYAIVIGEEFLRQPVGTVWGVTLSLLQAVQVAIVSAWGNIFNPDFFQELGLRIPAIYTVIILSSFCVVVYYLLRMPVDNGKRSFWKSAIPLGLLAAIFATLPFLLTGLTVGLRFPFDRLLLPMMIGSCLVMVGLVDFVGRKRVIRIVLVSALVAVSAGMHYLNGVSFQRDWETQKSFFSQLVTRMPGLAPGTTLVYEYSLALDNFRSTDNSLIPALNRVYNPDQIGESLQFNIADLRLRPQYRAEEIQPGMPVIQPYGPFAFTGSTDELLVIQFAPPWCVQVLEPENEGLYPNLPENLPRAVTYSNPGQILLNQQRPTSLPEAVFGKKSEPDWCGYYQSASLAAQQEDWEEVVRIGELAFSNPDPPRQPTERLPFILGYGYTGNWQRAEELSLDTRRRDKNTEELLCVAWQELEESGPEGDLKQETVNRMLEKFDCP